MTIEQKLREALRNHFGDAFSSWEHGSIKVILPILQAAIAAELKAAARIAELRAKEYQGELDAHIPSANWRSSVTSLRNETEWIQHEIEARIQPSRFGSVLSIAHLACLASPPVPIGMGDKEKLKAEIARERAKARAQAYLRCAIRTKHIFGGEVPSAISMEFEQWARAEEAKSAGASEGK